MKKFTKRLLLYVVPVLVLIVASEILLRKIPNDYAYKRNYLDKHAGEIEVLILGNSHEYYGLNPELFSKKGFNAAYASQSLNYDWAILKRYETKLKHLHYLILPADYFTLTSSLEHGEEKWRIKDYNLYYKININASFTDGFEIFTGKTQSKLIRIKNFYISRKKPVQCNALGFGSGFHSSKSKNLETTGKLAAKRHTLTKGEVNSYEKNTTIIRKFIAFAERKNIQLVFVASPVYKSYYSRLKYEQLQRTQGFFRLHAVKSNNVHYYNFMCDTTFHASDFYDGDHLNEKGAEKWSQKMEKILQKL